MIFKNRIQATALLVKELEKYRSANAVILAIPRGGIPMGIYASKELHLPMDIVLSKKIGHPFNKELAIGAVTEDDAQIDFYRDVDDQYVKSEINKIRALLKKRRHLYLGDRKNRTVGGKIVILIDDGIATGNTLLATIKMLRKKNPEKIVVAVPVIPADRVSAFRAACDELIYLTAPDYFPGVGAFYESFDQVSDEEVIQLLNLNQEND